MKELHILNLGAGVQSTAIYLMWMDGELDLPEMTCAIFADTQDESTAVYRNLDWLEFLGGPKIHRVTKGQLSSDLINGVNSTGQRFASIPAFTSTREGETQGMVRRQCTREYKIEPIEKFIRRELLNLKPRQRIPKDVRIHQYFGFSFDEPGRAARARLRFKQVRWGEVHFPLFDLQMTRRDCVKYLEGRVPHPVESSECVYCPFKSAASWRHLRDTDPEGWERACRIDEQIRENDALCGKGLEHRLYVHRSCVPLRRANLHDDQGTLFDMECEGGCSL